MQNVGRNCCIVIRECKWEVIRNQSDLSLSLSLPPFLNGFSLFKIVELISSERNACFLANHNLHLHLHSCKAVQKARKSSGKRHRSNKMREETPLDYAEFQLTPRRTRCELFISADGFTEKLASGFVKPFIAHLPAAETQVARGNQVIRLESNGRFSEQHQQQQSDNAWFSKGTLERFVRFVSTPEVIERVKTIEDELAQLEQVRSALASTFAQSRDRFSCGDSNNGFHKRRDDTHIVPRSCSIEAEDNETDASKRELLRAMEARLSALHQEQSMTFSRANAAGFDNNNIADLITFAKHFGADRLNDACVQFLALSRKRTESKGGHIKLDSPTTEAPSNGSELTLASGNETNMVSGEEAWLHGTKRRLDFGVKKLQTKHSGLPVEGARTATIPPVQSALSQQPFKDSSQKHVSGLSPGDQRSESASTGGMFFARLQQMAQQVEARSSEDFGWQVDPEMSDQSPQGSQISAPDLISWKEPACTSKNHHSSEKQSAGDQSHNQSHIHLSKNGHSTSSLPERSSSLPALRIHVESPRIWNPSSVEAESVRDPSSEDGRIKPKDSAKKPEEISAMETDSRNIQNTKEETPARRLSVQAAISLFESKKTDSSDPPFRKLVKQDSRKALTESCNSPSEKSVLKRWSGTNPFSPGVNSVQEKLILDSGGVERNLEPEFMKVKDGGSKDSSLDRVLDSQSQPIPDEQARENFKKSLKNLLHLDNTQQPEGGGISKGADADVQQVKPLPPMQQPSENTAGSKPGPNSQDQFRVDHAKNLTWTGVGAVVSLKAKADPTTTTMLTTVKMFKNTVTEVKSEGQTIPNSTSSNLNGKTEQEDKGSSKGPSTKESLPRSSDSVSHRSKMSAQVSMENDNTQPIMTAIPKQEQVADKRSETVKVKESSGGDSQSGNNTISGKISVRKKRSSGTESSTNLLTSPVDIHMQALVKMAENQYTSLSLTGEEIPNGQRGRFYEQYSRLRDEKLKGEHPAKRAEREAKLKSMQETLERRKAEMEGKAVRISKKNSRPAQSGGKKIQTQKAGLSVAQTEQKALKDEEEGTDKEKYTLRFQDQSLEYSNPTSPASTPRSSKNRASSLKPRATTKVAPTLQKSSSASRNSVRAAALSPSSTPKNPVGGPSQGKSPSPSNANVDSSAFKAVPSTTEWRKDVSKNSSTRATASARIHPKVNGSSRTVGDALSLADDGNNVANGDAMHSMTEKEELRHPSSIPRKSISSVSVSKISPAEAVNGTLLGSSKDQQEGATDPLIDGKARQSSLGVTQEVKAFLRKGRGIGPGAGPGIMKQKASFTVDASKVFDEDASTECKLDGMAVDYEDLKSTAEHSVKVHGIDDVGGVVDQEAFVTPSVPMMHIVNDGLVSPSHGQTDSGEVETLDYSPENASENGKVCTDTPSSNELSEENPEGAMPEDMISAAQGSFSPVLNRKQKEGSLLLSDLFARRNAESPQHNAGFVTTSMSFREASLPHGRVASPFAPASASQAYSSILQRGAVSGRFSPPGANVLDLPISSPALWNGSQAKYIPETDLIHSVRQLSGPQKPASMLPLPPKEPSKGFKRLLHFGRKSRPSETALIDCVSVSTTSEGDDDADEIREFGNQLSDDLLRRIRMQKRGFEYGNMVDHYSSPDQDTAQFFGSSIPPPPANFKLREEHLTGGNLIKAPRSFFSLSSFRSKGSEGKSR